MQERLTMLFRMLYDEKLAQASYFLGCQRTAQAIVVDPQRDVDRYIDLAAMEGLSISAIAETHIHADFLSGARELAESTGARLYLSDEGGPLWRYEWLAGRLNGGSYDHCLLSDGQEFLVGNIRLKAVHTPGHTPEHLSFLITDEGSRVEEPMGIITGDFVFVRDVGRPDLLETAAGIEGAAESSARLLFQSIQKFRDLPDYLQLWPGHGPGSACGKALGAVPQSTVGYEKRHNSSVNYVNGEGEFVRDITRGQPAPPLYFARMKRQNREGPAVLGGLPSPESWDASRLADHLGQDGILIDTRPWFHFVEGHLKGSIYAPLDRSFPTVVGSYVEPEQEVCLIVEPERVREAVIDLIHIGIDRVGGFVPPKAVAKSSSDLHKTACGEPVDLMKAGGGEPPFVVDVRNPDEYEESHIPGAINIAYTRLAAHLEELPRNQELWVQCRSGVRSSYATAFLESRNYRARQLNGGILKWISSGGPTVSDAAG
jgi:hydroxyacylglutathione hydrolase